MLFPGATTSHGSPSDNAICWCERIPARPWPHLLTVASNIGPGVCSAGGPSTDVSPFGHNGRRKEHGGDASSCPHGPSAASGASGCSYAAGAFQAGQHGQLSTCEDDGECLSTSAKVADHHAVLVAGLVVQQGVTLASRPPASRKATYGT